MGKTKNLWKWAPAPVCIAAVFGFCLLYHYRAPYHDHWDLIPFYGAMQSGELAFRDVFALHGNHWHASGYVILLGLSKWTGMSHGLESAASVAFACLGFIALVRILWRSMALLNVPSAAAWVIGVSAFFLFSLDQSANWLWGWQVAVFINLAGALWVIERLTAGPTTIGKTFIAAVACAVSVYAFGTGWVLIPIGFTLLFVQRSHSPGQRRAALAIWAALTGLLLCHFWLALNDVAAAYTTSSIPNFLDLGTWIGLLHYTLNFVASPIIRFARDSALIAMVIGFGVLLWSLRTIRVTRKWQNEQAVSPFLALAAFSLGSGLLTAIGRWEAFGVQHAFVSRYISFGSFFWIAVFTLAIFAITMTPHKTHKRTFAVLGLLFVLKLGNIPSVIQKSVKISNQIAMASDQLAATYPDTLPEAYTVLHSPFQKIEPHLETLSEHEASLFKTRRDGEDPERVS